MRLISDVMVPAPDGVLLATDVYLPEGSGPFPVVMERTPYGKTRNSRSEVTSDGTAISRRATAQAFCDHGIAVVFQDVRGRYGSQGTFTKYVNEAHDGYATGEWIAAQQWCDGRIGTFGLSYAAHTQLALACLGPRWLAGMVLDSGGFSNAYHCGIRQGGAFELKQATWAVRQERLAAGKRDAFSSEELADLERWFSDMPWAPGHAPLDEQGPYLAYLVDQWTSGTYDESWQRLGLAADEYYDQIPDVPVIHMSSWYDAYVPSTLENYRAFRERLCSPQQLIMGPWLHGDRTITHSGDADFGPEADFEEHFACTWLDYRVRWFADIFAGKATARRVDVFVMGAGRGRCTAEGRLDHGGKWIDADIWPLPSTRVERFWPESTGGLGRTRDTGEVLLVADPNDPVPTIGGSITSGKPLFFGGGFDQIEAPGFLGADGSGQPLTSRDDVVSFQTEPLEQDLVLMGEVEVEVSVVSDTPDFDICAKLVDVYPPSEAYPDGFALNLTDGIKRARYRDSWTEPTLVTAGEPVRLTVRPFETSNTVKAGHRLRLDLSGSNFPHFDVNPNTGGPEGRRGERRVAHLRIDVGETSLAVRTLQRDDSCGRGA